MERNWKGTRGTWPVETNLLLNPAEHPVPTHTLLPHTDATLPSHVLTPKGPTVTPRPPAAVDKVGDLEVARHAISQLFSILGYLVVQVYGGGVLQGGRGEGGGHMEGSGKGWARNEQWMPGMERVCSPSHAKHLQALRLLDNSPVDLRVAVAHADGHDAGKRLQRGKVQGINTSQCT